MTAAHLPVAVEPSSEGSAATGVQYEIHRAGARAVITALAGALRVYELHGTALIETYGPDEIAPSANGIQLSPWPNRVRDGLWHLDGQPQQLDLTEPSRGNASHGLLRNTGLTPVLHSQDRVVLRGQIHPQHGYPFRLTHQVDYHLDPDGGLQVTQSLTNHSERSAPVAFGAHPFLRLGEVPSEELTLTVPGATQIIADEQLIPVGSRAVEDTEDDFRQGAPVGERLLDAAYTDLTPDQDGRVRCTLTAPDGRTVELWSETAYRYVHVFITNRYPGRHRAVALEPMTAPADALNSGDGLVWLETDQTLSATWGITGRLA